MALEGQQCAGHLDAAVPPPTDQRSRQTGNQLVGHCRPVAGGAHQWLDDVGRDLDGGPGEQVGPVAIEVESATAQIRVVAVEDRRPVLELASPVRDPRMLAGSPVPPCCPRVGKVNGSACRDLRARGGDVRHQDSPRHRIHHEVVSNDQQSAGHTRSRIEPREPQHDAVLRSKPVHLLEQRLAQGILVSRRTRAAVVRQIHAAQQRVHVHRSGCTDAQRLGVAIEPGPQDVVGVDDRAHGGRDLVCRDVGRKVHHHRHHEPAGVSAAFDHARCGGTERGQRRVTWRSKGFGTLGCRLIRVGRGTSAIHRSSERDDRAVLQHIPGGEVHSGRPGAADELHREDAVAAEFEERVVGTHRLGTHQLADDAAEHLLGRGRRCPARSQSGLG